jgi:hypothetical protein
VSELCENCGTPASYTLEGELGMLCYCTLKILTEEEQK